MLHVNASIVRWGHATAMTEDAPNPRVARPVASVWSASRTSTSSAIWLSCGAFGLLRAKLLANPGPNTRLTLTYAHSQSQAPQIVGVTPPFDIISSVC